MTRIILLTGIKILVIGSLAIKSYGQISTANGARAIGMANTSSLIKDEIALFNNPGALNSKSLALIASYNTYYISLGINDALIGITSPLGTLQTGLGVSYYGDNLYNQLEISTAAAHKIGFAQLGLRANYQQYYLENYGYKQAFSLDLGGVFTLSPEFEIGMMITNLNRATLPEQETYSLSSLLALAFSYKPIPAFRVDMQATKDLSQPVSASLGMEYLITDHISARTGFDLSGSIAALGVGFNWSEFEMDLGGQYQPQLGYTGAITLIISKKTNE